LATVIAKINHLRFYGMIPLTILYQMIFEDSPWHQTPLSTPGFNITKTGDELA
jgi:hypothetical protein